MVPERVPVAGLVPTATVTLVVAPVTVLPTASCTVTTVVIALPAVALAGCVVKASLLGAPGVRLKALLVAPVRPVAAAVSVYPLPALSILRVENVATPFTAATVVVPDRVPLAGLLPTATVTIVAAPVTGFPAASSPIPATPGVTAPPPAPPPPPVPNPTLFTA